MKKNFTMLLLVILFSCSNKESKNETVKIISIKVSDDNSCVYDCISADNKIYQFRDRECRYKLNETIYRAKPNFTD